MYIRILSIVTLILTANLTTAAELLPKVPNISAQSYIVVDISNGSVIAEKNSNTKLPPASLTKLMTAYITSYQLDKGILAANDLVKVSKKAWKAPGSRMFIEVDKTVSVLDLLKGIIIQSGNDASTALAEHIADSEDDFAILMNDFAKSLGMQQTNFKNATGLPQQDHYTTAADLAILAKHIINDFPDDYALYAEKSFSFNNIKQFNRNKLLWIDKSVDGLKTGHTEESGYSLVSSAKRDNTRLIAVVIGSESDKERITDSKKLLNYGFRYFETYQAFTPGEILKEVQIFGGKTGKLKLRVENSTTITLMKGKKKDIKTSVNLDKYITAPIAEGDKLGEIIIALDGNTLSNVPLVATESVESGNFLIRTWHNIVILFYKMFNIEPDVSTIMSN